MITTLMRNYNLLTRNCIALRLPFCKVHDDILRAVDRGCTVVLLLLDLSAAFDTVDHGLLLHRLNTWFGIKGKVLAWFKSYLTDRSQVVSIDGSNSSDVWGSPGICSRSNFVFIVYASSRRHYKKT